MEQHRAIPGICRAARLAARRWRFFALASLAVLAPVWAQGQGDPAGDAVVESHLAAARSAEARKDYLAAAREYEQILAIRPGWALIRQSLGVTLHLSGRYEQAIEALRGATELDDQLWGAYLFLGMDYYQVHRFEQAVDALRRSLTISPGLIEARRWLGLSLAATGRHDEAIEHLQRVAQADPSDPEALFSLVRAYDRGADRLFDRIGTMAPQSPFVHLLQAERFIADGSPGRARAEFDLALAKRPDLAGVLEFPGAAAAPSPPDGPFGGVRREFGAGRHEQAAGMARETLSSEPDSLEAMYWLGRCYKLLAVAALDRLVSLAPDSHRVDQLRAEAHMDATEFPKAVEAYHRALGKRPTLPGLRFALGRALEGVGSFDDARVRYEEELERNPHHALARLYLGRLLLRRGDAVGALPHIREAVGASAGLPDSRLDLGRAYLEVGDLDAAVEELNAYASQNPANDRVHYLLASAYRGLDRPEDARRELLEYQELSRRRLREVQADVRSVSDDLERIAK